jgi:FkbM family methyltransferase
MTNIHEQWRKDRGDDFLVIDYPLNENSQVIELGGYQGLWTKRISKKFDCNVLVIEPITEFYNQMNNEFDQSLNNRQKIKTENFGISTEEKTLYFSVNGDATSSHFKSQSSLPVKCFPLEYFLTRHHIDKVDLIQINIEGEEYPLMEKWIQSQILKKFRYIQVQYHRIGENYELRHKNIQEGLKKLGFNLKWEYPFVWESWENTFFNS